MNSISTLASGGEQAAAERERASGGGLWLPGLSLAGRELVRFWRQPNRVIGALGTPVVFWLLIGGGMAGSFAGGAGESYIQYFFPGTLVMILLFTAIFSTISIIEDRREGFLQSVLVAPIPRGAIVLGKVLGGTALASAQGMLFLALAPLVGFSVSLPGFLLAAGLMILLSFALTAMGFCIAWWMNSSQAFHAIMNLFLMPMWFLSGALFPPQGAWAPLKWIMMANPLTYGVDGLRNALRLPQQGGLEWGQLGFNIAITAVFATGLFVLAAWMAHRDVESEA
jgi:ABC-2 type transport system permease protein